MRQKSSKTFKRGPMKDTKAKKGKEKKIYVSTSANKDFRVLKPKTIRSVINKKEGRVLRYANVTDTPVVRVRHEVLKRIITYKATSTRIVGAIRVGITVGSSRRISILFSLARRV